MRQTYKTHVVLGTAALVSLAVATAPHSSDVVAAVSLAVADVAPFLVALIAAHGALLYSTGAASARSKWWIHVATVLLGASVVELSDVLLWLHGIAVDRFLDAEQVSAMAVLREYGESVFFGALLWGSTLLATPWLAHAASLPGPVRLPQLDQPATAAAAAAAATLPQPNQTPAGVLQEIRKSGMHESVEYLKAEGNYIDVIGATGHKLLAYRFARAVKELGPVGIQVHRSYWVAHDAVSHVARSGKNTVIVLKSQRTVPVSNRYLLAVRSLPVAPHDPFAGPKHGDHTGNYLP